MLSCWCWRAWKDRLIVEQVEFDFGIIQVGDHYLIGEMREGADVLEDAIYSVVKLARDRFEGHPWVYISNRVHSYSHQPAAQVLLGKLDANLVAYAVVLGHPGHEVLIDLERSLAEGKHAFEVFDELQPSIDWATSVLQTQDSTGAR